MHHAFRVWNVRQGARRKIVIITLKSGCFLCEIEGGLAGADLRKIDLHNADFAEQNLTGANLTDAIINSADFSDANLTGAILENVTAVGLYCYGATFDTANLRGGDFYWMNAFEASFRHVDANAANFAGAGLENADFTNAVLVNAYFGRDNLNGSTSLQGADFTDANLSGANFEGAECDDSTRFPKNFDPKKRGMVYRSHLPKFKGPRPRYR